MGASFDRSLLLSLSNIRKAKGQTVAVIALVFLSSFMMNLWLMLATDYKKNFDRYHDKLNDGHINIAAYVADDDFWEFISDALESSSDVTDFTLTDAFVAPVSFGYGGGEVSQMGVLLEKEDAVSRKTGKFEITEDSGFTSGIYLPMLYGTGDNYSAGDTIELTLLGQRFEYTVCGFFNNTMSGSHNCGLVSFLLTEDKFEELSHEDAALESVYVSVRINDITRSGEFGTSLKEMILEKFPSVTIAGNDYKIVTTSRYVSQMICGGVMSAMAFLVLLIGTVIICSNVANYIHENMRNLGALKAVGYTGGQLVFALIMQFSGISAVTAAVGAALSYCVFPSVNEMMIAQTGIPYEMRFLPLPFFVTVVSVLGIAALAVYFSARKIKSIDTVTAIRQGITTHNFKKNHLLLEKTSMPINAAMAIKTMLLSFKQNITICVTMLVLSLVAVFSGVMFKNVIVDMQTAVDLIVGESADSCINVNTSIEEEFVRKLQADSRVEEFYLFSNNNIEPQHVGGDTLYASVIDDYSKLNNQLLIEGRFPKYENEAAVGAKYAKDNGIRVGDELTLKIGGSSAKYIVSGFVQWTNNLGRDCILTREGCQKISELQNVGYYINLKDGTDIDDFNNEISELFSGDVNAVFNFSSIIEGTGRVYVELMTVIVAAVLIICCIVIIFVIYLLVMTLLNGKRRDYGILKALGFTSGQLAFQTALSFMPSVVISSAAGILISTQIINPLLSLFFGDVGIVKCAFEVPVGFNVIAGTGLVLFTFAAACIMSLKVKRIAPRELLSGE